MLQSQSHQHRHNERDMFFVVCDLDNMTLLPNFQYQAVSNYQESTKIDLVIKCNCGYYDNKICLT